MTKPKFALLVPTRNAERFAKPFLNALQRQSYQPDRLIIADSDSSDETVSLFHEGGFESVPIDPKCFDHGGTRQLLAEQVPEAEILVFMTQDAILADTHSLESIVNAFDQSQNIGAVCGRQLPAEDANQFAVYARLHNYPNESNVRTSEDFARLGIKTAFMSNSFAAYRKKIFNEVGGFPRHSIFGEDLLVAGKMLIEGYSVAYASDATVLHSHNYTLQEEFSRYFDVGVMRRSQDDIVSKLGQSNNRALEMILQELKYMAVNRPVLVPVSIARTVCRAVSYQLGKQYRILPKSLCKRFSFCKSYWRSAA